MKMDMNGRANMLWDEGIFIDKYIDLLIITNLYYLDSFFVEVVLSNKDGRITEITTFKHGERLEKYIRHRAAKRRRQLATRADPILPPSMPSDEFGCGSTSESDAGHLGV